MRKILLAALLGLPGLPPAWAGPGAPLDQVLASPDAHCSLVMLSNISKNNDFANIQDGRHIACASMPASPGLALVVYLPLSAASGSGQDETDDVDIFVVSAVTGDVLARRVDRGGLHNSENFAFSAVSLDTAAYLVAPGERAFGVRFTDTHAHGPHMGEEDDLALYLVRDRQIVPIMPRVATRLSRASRGAGCPDGRHVNDAAFDEDRVTLQALNTSSHGMADIGATLVRTTGVGSLKGGDCAPGSRPDRTRRYVLRYDGKQYAVPRDLQLPDRGSMSQADLLQLPGRSR